jgi:hypothetical protein
MLRSFSLKNQLAWFAVASACAFGCAATLASSASASTFEVGCGELQNEMETVAGLANHGKGEVIVLNGLCDAENLGKTSGVTIPAGADFTLEGKPGTTSGFGGEGVKSSMLQSEPGHEVGSLTIANLVFEHANVTTPVAAALTLIASQLTLTGDTFSEDTDTEGQGGAVDIEISPDNCPSAGSTALAITDSTFREDKLVSTSERGEGGALWVQQDCPAANSVLQGDVFEGNTLEGSASSLRDMGGAVWMVTNASEAVSALRQSADVFASNRILATGGKGNYGGGGEWLEGISLTSVGDRYSGNSIPGTTGAGQWSWGAGLSLLNSVCNPKTATKSTLENAVVAGNSIGAGDAADLGGAGIYVGCAVSEGTPNELELQDSTVTENTTPAGGVAGIDGGPSDQMTLENSIVAGDVGGSETSGFTGAGGSLTASYSDVCGGTSPLGGPGNICANPLLADNGNPSSADVHETASSPTIDAGSNALVPSGLSTDAFGDPRILAGHQGCNGEGPKVVDMGAYEFPPSLAPIPACAPGAVKPVPGLTQFVSIKVTSKGVALKLSCKGTSGQVCSGGAEITTAETLAGKGKKVVAVSTEVHHGKVPDKVPVKIAEAAFSFAGGTSTTVQLKLNKTGLALLKRFKAMPALVLGNEATASGPFLFIFHGVRFTEAKKPKKKKHKHHPKRH